LIPSSLDDDKITKPISKTTSKKDPEWASDDGSSQCPEGWEEEYRESRKRGHIWRMRWGWTKQYKEEAKQIIGDLGFG
jgi:hypothetical protein